MRVEESRERPPIAAFVFLGLTFGWSRESRCYVQMQRCMPSAIMDTDSPRSKDLPYSAHERRHPGS